MEPTQQRMNTIPIVVEDCTTCAFKSWDIHASPCAPCLNKVKLLDNGFYELPYWTPNAGEAAAQMAQAPAAALDRQVGGEHYTRMRIQPYEFAIANDLDGCQLNIIKYTCREKGDLTKRLEDLDKAIHTLEVYKELLKKYPRDC